jgi:type IV pilus assembly protein PilB
MDILALLAEKGIIDTANVASITDEIAQGKSLEQALLDRGISIEDVLTAQGEYFQIPTKHAVGQVPFDILNYIPEESAKHYQFVPLGIEDGVLEVGTIDPDNLEATEALNFIVSKTNLPYKLYLISEQDFHRVIEMYKGLSGEVGKALGELQTTLSDDEKESESEQKTTDVGRGAGDIQNIKEDAPVTKIVATIVRYAVDGSASDIHIEPTRDELRVRFRVDGVLHTSLHLPVTVQRSVVARIKVLANLKLDERRKPQDGRFSATINERRVDFRVSTFPTSHGEKVVMRILDRDQKRLTLTDLGLSEAHVSIVRRAVQRP